MKKAALSADIGAGSNDAAMLAHPHDAGRSPRTKRAPDKATAGRSPLQTVTNALSLLGCFGVDREWLGVRELGRLLQLNGASVHNLLVTLASSGFVEQHAETRKYRLGLGVVRLAGTKLAQLDLVSAAGPLIKELMHSTGETITLSVLYGDELLYLAKAESVQPVRVASRIGGSAPIHCSANGKALLAFRSRFDIDRVLAQPLRRFNESTITDPAALLADLVRIRELGYATDFGNYIADIHAVAAPIRDEQSLVIASLGIIAPATRLRRSDAGHFAALAMTFADRISRSMGWRGPEPRQARKTDRDGPKRRQHV